LKRIVKALYYVRSLTEIVRPYAIPCDISEQMEKVTSTWAAKKVFAKPDRSTPSR